VTRQTSGALASSGAPVIPLTARSP
jgi:hypothetical protein